MYRPHVEIEEGPVRKIDLPTNIFYCCAPANLLLFIGQNRTCDGPTFGECIFQLAAIRCPSDRVRRIVWRRLPHTRLPRLYVSLSDASLLPEMEQYGVRRTVYQGPGSFTTYLMTQAKTVGLEIVSLVAEIPGYLCEPGEH